LKHRQVFNRSQRRTKSVLRLLDLEHAKSAVLNSLTSSDAQRGYRHAIDEFVDFCCSEPPVYENHPFEKPNCTVKRPRYMQVESD
jgi:hypothetical protein